MNDDKCPFCSEPRIRSSLQGNLFRCGTLGPDINGEYWTGHTCDIHTYTRLLAAKDAEIQRLQTAITQALHKLECVVLERSSPHVPEILAVCDRQAISILQKSRKV